jgi:hypothetical protein
MDELACVAGDTLGAALLAKACNSVSNNGPYQKAVRSAYTKFMSAEFEKMLDDPKEVAQVVAKAVTVSKPRAIYNGNALAGKILTMNKLLIGESLCDAFTR